PRLTDAERARILEPFPAGLALLREVIDDRRRRPGDDLLSNLVHAHDAGDRLDADELVALVMALIAAGAETTTHLICFAVATLLARFPQLRLAGEPVFAPHPFLRKMGSLPVRLH